MAVTLAKWTIEEYQRMVATGCLTDRHVELLNGTIVEMSPEGPEHAGGSTSTRDYLSDLLGKQVMVRDAKPITLPESGSEPEPDIAVVKRRENYYRDRHPYPDEIFLLIEFSNSSLQKDLGEKRDAYAAAGILEYWVVDLRASKVIVFRQPVDGIYQTREELSVGNITPVAFPSTAIKVKHLLP